MIGTPPGYAPGYSGAESLKLPACAFEDCQAGGAILAGAPMVRVDGLPGRVRWYHPGCWAAERRRPA